MTSTTMPRAAVARAVPTRTLLAGGIAAGPVFGVVAAAQVLTRDGFDLSRQPLSLLALGELGWIQIANFVVSGLLALAGAALRRPRSYASRNTSTAPVRSAAVRTGTVSQPESGASPQRSPEVRRPVIAVFTSHWLAMVGLGLVLTAIVMWACLLPAKLRHGDDNPYVGLATSFVGGLLVIGGDALTNTIISFQHPSWRVPVDHEPDRGISTRLRLLDQLATDKRRLVGAHLPFPGTGFVERKDGAYRFVPA